MDLTKISIQRKSGQVFSVNKSLPNTGIIFLMCFWSQASQYLNYLIMILEEYPKINLYLIDIDGPEYKMFFETYGEKSHGFGETFWISNSEIIFSLHSYKENKDLVRGYNDKLQELL